MMVVQPQAQQPTAPPPPIQIEVAPPQQQQQHQQQQHLQQPPPPSSSSSEGGAVAGNNNGGGRREVKHDLSPEIASKSLSALKVKTHTSLERQSHGFFCRTARKRFSPNSATSLALLLQMPLVTWQANRCFLRVNKNRNRKSKKSCSGGHPGKIWNRSGRWG